MSATVYGEPDVDIPVVLALQDAIREIRRIYPRMEAGQLEVLLHILSSPGIRAADIVRDLDGINRTGIYKTLRVLTRPVENPLPGRKDGLSLVDVVPDPSDGRASLYYPSPAGEILASKIRKAMGKVRR